MTDEKINSTANNIQIDIDNLSYVDYLWTQRTSDTAIQGIRLDQRNLPPIKCYNTSTDDTAGTWTVSIPNVTELTEGLTIKIRLKTSYNSTINTLNVNGLGAKTIYFRYGNKLTSHYAKESVLALTYTENAISSGNDRSGWIIENIYDSTNTFQLRKYYTRYKTKSALYRYMICFVNKDDELIPANNVNNSTATTKTLTTESFMPSKGIYYYNSTTTVAAAKYTGNATLYQQLGLINLQYSFNTGTTLTANQPVYLVVTPQADGQVKLASTPIAQTLPTSDTDNLYIFLGTAYDNYKIELTIEHPIYVYRNGYCESLDMSHDRALDSISSMAHTHSNKSILDNTTASFTTTDKTKLDGIETGANKTTVDTEISSTSTNPVQNKVISSALGFKANLSNGNYFVGDQSITGALNITAASGAGQITIKGTTGYHPGGVTLQTTGTSETKATTITIPAKTGTMALLSDLPSLATASNLGVVKSSTTGTAANRDYNVQVNSDGTMKVNVPWTDTNTDTHYTNYLQIKGNGTEAVKFTQNADKSLNLKPGSNVSISAASGEITISSTNTNTSHSHSAGVGLVGSGSAGTSGTYTYKAKLRSETPLTVDSAAETTLGKVYPIAVDKSGYLSVNAPLAGFEDILKGIRGIPQVEWNELNAGEYGSNSTYNKTTLPPIILENNSGFWNSASGRPLDISFHFAKKEKITTLQVKCPPYSGVNPTMTVYYAQNGDTGLTLYKEIATISTADSKTYEFNEEGISADYWVIRFTSSGWIDLRLCSPGGLFTTGLYTKECHQQIMDRFGGYQPIGNYALKSEIPTKSSWNYDDTYVKYSASQTLTDTQKSQARTNIGAGTSNFTGYTSSNKLHTDYINNAAGWTSNKGTVTNVRVQAGTGLSSSQSTAQTNTLDTTISIASGYKLPTTTEWAERPSINDAYSISAGNGIVLTPSASSLEISVNSTSSVTSGSTALVTSGAVYSAIQSAITTALNTSV